VRNEQKSADEKAPPPPWPTYLAALDTVHQDLAKALKKPEAAHKLAKVVADDEENAFSKALEVIRDIVPVDPELDAPTQEFRTRLQLLLAMPVLDGLSAVLELAASEVGDRWKLDVLPSLSGDQSSLEICAAGGALQQFRNEYLDPFFRSGRPRLVLEDRAMPLGGGFTDWIDRTCGAGGRGGGGGGGGGGTGRRTVEIAGRPTQVIEGSVLALRTRLSVICEDGEFVYEYGTGTPSRKRFKWSESAGCEEVGLQAWVLENDEERELDAKYWRGARAVPAFLRAAQQQGQDRFRWVLRYPGSIVLSVEYQVVGGAEIRKLTGPAAPPTEVTQ
jgi:hypothetical protein